MLVVVILVLLVMLTTVLPAFTDVYDNLTGSLTASSLTLVFPCTGGYKVCKTKGPLFPMMAD